MAITDACYICQLWSLFSHTPLYIISKLFAYTNKKWHRRKMMKLLKRKSEMKIEGQQAERKNGNRYGIYYFDSRQKGDVRYCAGLMCAMIGELLSTRERNGVVFLCIGTDRSTGDSLGPLIGSNCDREMCEDFRLSERSSALFMR